MATEKDKKNARKQTVQAPIRKKKESSPLSSHTANPLPARVFNPVLLIFVVTIAFCVQLVGPSVITLWERSNEKENLTADIRHEQERNDQLKKEVSDLNDDEFLKDQIRERLQLYSPDETPKIIEQMNKIQEKEDQNEENQRSE